MNEAQVTVIVETWRISGVIEAMINIRFIFLFLVIAIQINAQDNYIRFDDFCYNDQQIIDSLRSDRTGNFLVYFTIDSAISKSSEDLITFLVWQDKEKTYFQMITSESIYKPEELTNSQIFNYGFINITGASVEEDILIPSTGYLDPIYYEDIVMFYSSDYSFFYELKDPGSYVPDRNKEKYRAEWVSLIKKELFSKISRLKKESKYKRPKL